MAVPAPTPRDGHPFPKVDCRRSPCPKLMHSARWRSPLVIGAAALYGPGATWERMRPV